VNESSENLGDGMLRIITVTKDRSEFVIKDSLLLRIVA